MVVCNHGETFTCGLGGSLRIWRLAFLSVWPTVLTPTWYPAVKKFWSLSSPCPVGTDSDHLLFASPGNNSPGVSWSLGKQSAGLPFLSSLATGWYPASAPPLPTPSTCPPPLVKCSGSSASSESCPSSSTSCWKSSFPLSGAGSSSPSWYLSWCHRSLG